MTEDTPSTKTPKPGPMAIRFDWRDWEQYLEDSDIPDDKKQEFVETLWAIVMGFVDLGFGLNPTQEICGEVIDVKAVLEAAVLGSDNSSEQIKGDAA